ncbi:DnaJ-like protein xdj1 [Friedmanniomyces endolithicus]|nr:DnaJ-like protein xdj1 [Friedmanniomyces endolithicus]
MTVYDDTRGNNNDDYEEAASPKPPRPGGGSSPGMMMGMPSPSITDRRMTVDQQLYEILDVPEDASQEQLRQAYETALLKTHPDKVRKDEDSQHDAAERFRTVQRAFDILSNERSLQRYDEDGLEAVNPKPDELERAAKAFETFQRRDNDPHQNELLV